MWACPGLSGVEPYSSRCRLLLRWGTETPERVPVSWSYTRRPLIGRQNHTSLRQGDITNTLSARYFWTTAKALFIQGNVAQKFAVLLGRPTLLIFVHCARSSFSLYISRLHCVGLETRAVTELCRTLTTPPSRTEPTCTLRWKCANSVYFALS